jgi:hypothetical protein
VACEDMDKLIELLVDVFGLAIVLRVVSGGHSRVGHGWRCTSRGFYGASACSSSTTRQLRQS